MRSARLPSRKLTRPQQLVRQTQQPSKTSPLICPSLQPRRSPARCQQHSGRCRRGLTTAAAPNGPEGNPRAGDERVQDSLVDMLNLQIGQQHVVDFFEDESDKLRRTAEEAKEEVERLNKLELDRSTLAFGSALADINQSADEFEQQLLAQRKEMEADAAALVTWQRQMAVDRSRGQFFKSLYQADLEEEEIKGQPQQRFKALAERQLAPPPPAPSTLQLITCSFLAGVLVMAVAVDLASPSPAWAVDGLYVTLAMGLGASAYTQRGAL